MGKKIVLLTLVIFALIAAAAFLYFDRVLVIILEKKYDLVITYRSAAVKPRFTGNRLLLDIDIHDLYFAKRKMSGTEGYDTLAALVSSPFNGKWKYKEVRAQLEPGKNGVKINDLDAAGDQVKLSVKGDYYYNDTVDLNIIIHFSSKLKEKIPPEFAKTILSGEKNGWETLSARLTGDVNKPSIQVSSKLFRLTIKEASVSGPL